MYIKCEQQPAPVSATTKQAGEAQRQQWDWVERTVWTDRMLEPILSGPWVF